MFTKLVLLTALLAAAYGCSPCHDHSPRQRYCRSKWVALLSIEAVVDLGSEIEITARVLVLFKAGGLSIGAVVKIRTPKNDCGVHGLQIGKILLLSGDIDVAGLLSIDLCGQVQLREWLLVDLDIKLALLGGLWNNCHHGKRSALAAQ